jgi:hypothetical protein
MKIKEVLIVCLASSLGWIIGDIINTPKENHIPYPYQIQQMLRTEGYDLAVDGKIGPDTLKCWNDYIEKHSKQMADEMTAEAIRKSK